MTDAWQALKSELKELEKARDVLAYSYNKCVHTPIDSSLGPEQLETFEALTSRFARLSDMIIQRIFRYLDRYDLEESGTASPMCQDQQGGQKGDHFLCGGVYPDPNAA